jgi:probable rRNA maturation factor
MTICFENETDQELDFDYENILEKVIRQAAEQEKCPYEFEVNVTFTDNDSIREINREFRELDVPTDVLSFPMVDYPAPADFSELEEENASAEYFHPETGELILGDIVISVERARMQAEEYGHSLKREICFLTAHSMLHLFGYDHIEDEERVEMEQRQEQILQALGIASRQRFNIQENTCGSGATGVGKAWLSQWKQQIKN